jgi:hypothetical protein
VINTQVATNSASAPATTRWRIIRTRAIRARLTLTASVEVMHSSMRPVRSKRVSAR